MNGNQSYPRRGDVYWVSLDPTVGSETKKTRPGLILSNNIGSKQLSPEEPLAKIRMIAFLRFHRNLTLVLNPLLLRACEFRAKVKLRQNHLKID